MTTRKARNKAAERARKRALGLVPVEVWILPASKPDVQAIVARDRKRAERTTSAPDHPPRR